MQRRTFVGALLAAGAYRAQAQLVAQSTVHDGEIKGVLVMFKCHFDGGFIDTQAKVLRSRTATSTKI